MQLEKHRPERTMALASGATDTAAESVTICDCTRSAMARSVGWSNIRVFLKLSNAKPEICFLFILTHKHMDIKPTYTYICVYKKANIDTYVHVYTYMYI